jgi:hypothetical protein
VRRPEEALHRQVVDLLHVLENRGVLTFFHPANGFKRSKAEAGIGKALGVRAGTPDLIVFSAGRAFGLELKAPKGRVLPSQKEWAARAEQHGVPTAICRSLDEVLDALRGWGITNARAA